MTYGGPVTDEQTGPLTLDDVSDTEFMAALGALIAQGVIKVDVEPVDEAEAPSSAGPGARQDGL
jgi:hypothetical protein